MSPGPSSRSGPAGRRAVVTRLVTATPASTPPVSVAGRPLRLVGPEPGPWPTPQDAPEARATAYLPHRTAAPGRRAMSRPSRAAGAKVDGARAPLRDARTMCRRSPGVGPACRPTAARASDRPRPASTTRRGPHRLEQRRLVRPAAVEAGQPPRAAGVEAAARGDRGPRRASRRRGSGRAPRSAGGRGVGEGTTDTSARVYGWRGARTTCSVGPISTIWPRYMTAIRSRSPRRPTGRG